MVFKSPAFASGRWRNMRGGILWISRMTSAQNAATDDVIGGEGAGSIAAASTPRAATSEEWGMDQGLNNLLPPCGIRMFFETLFHRHQPCSSERTYLWCRHEVVPDVGEVLGLESIGMRCCRAVAVCCVLFFSLVQWVLFSTTTSACGADHLGTWCRGIGTWCQGKEVNRVKIGTPVVALDLDDSF